MEDVQKLVRDVSDGNVMQLKEKLMRYHQRGCLIEKPAKIKKDGALMAALTAWSEFAAPLIEELLTSDPRFAGIKTKTTPKELAEIAAYHNYVKFFYHTVHTLFFVTLGRKVRPSLVQKK